jgi:predicted RNA-binding Zn-ribbon protein involved in translation (DUF1610 family)
MVEHVVFSGMVVSERRLLVRFFQIGSVLALAGSLHVLTLLLPWYTVRADAVSTSVLSGYILPETLILSVLGGVLAGLSLLVTSFSQRVTSVRTILVALSLLGGVLALVSPLYLGFVRVPALSVAGEPGIGFFVALFSAIVILALGIVALLTRPRVVEIPYQSYGGLGAATAGASQSLETTSFEVAGDVEEGIVCPICYTSVEAENAVKCSSCGVVFHSGCLDAYVNINGTCPNCGRAVV